MESAALRRPVETSADGEQAAFPVWQGSLHIPADAKNNRRRSQGAVDWLPATLRLFEEDTLNGELEWDSRL